MRLKSYIRKFPKPTINVGSIQVSTKRCFCIQSYKALIFCVTYTLALTQLSASASSSMLDPMFRDVKVVSLAISVFSKNETLRPNSSDRWWVPRALELAREELKEFAPDVRVVDRFETNLNLIAKRRDILRFQIKVTVTETNDGAMVGALSILTFRYLDPHDDWKLTFDHAAPTSFLLNAPSATLRDDLFEIIASIIRLRVTDPIIAYRKAQSD